MVEDAGCVCETISTRYGVKVNFRDRHENYYTAWRYTTKEDVHSTNHPDLGNIGAPITTNASSATRASRLADGDGGVQKGKRKKTLTIFDVSQVAVEKNIKTHLQLVALASEQKRAGKTDLAEFIANRGAKAVEEALGIGWEMENAELDLASSKLTRVEILYREIGSLCVEGCQGKWMEMAEQVLQRNDIGWFQKISIPIPQAASRNSEGEGGTLTGIPRTWGGSLDWNSEGMGGFIGLEFRRHGGIFRTVTSSLV